MSESDSNGVLPLDGDDNPFNKPDACRLCPLFYEPGIVRGVGPDKPSIVVVGEAPGADEVEPLVSKRGFSRPFIGGAGRVFSSWCHMAGLNKRDMYVTYTVKCRPPGNRTPSTAEVRACAPFLIQEIRERDPNLIIALGGIPLQTLTGKESITLHRGVPIEGFGGKKILPTFDPIFTMRSPQYFIVPVIDLQRAQKEQLYGEIRRLETEYVVDGSLQDWEQMEKEVRAVGGFTTDIETTDLDPRYSQMVCFGISPRPGRAFVFRNAPQFWSRYQALLGDPTLEKRNQNLENFDLPYLEAKGATFRGERFDPMVAFHLTNSDLPKDLGMISTFFTDIPYWKDQAGENLMLYNAKDCDGSERNSIGLKSELKQLGMWDLYYKRVSPVQPILRKMNRTGFKINEERAVAWGFAMERRADQMEAALREALGRPSLNVQSPKDMHDLLYNVLKLPVQYKRTKNGNRPTADKEAIANLAEISDNPVLHHIVTIRSLRHTKSTYCDVERDDRGFVHPSFGTSKAATGRFNCVNPNAQNQPEEIRVIYIPDDEDHVIICSDWSQIEWRTGMVISGDSTGLEALAKGIDTHKLNAALALSKRMEDITDEERHHAKFIVYGLLYGRGAASIAAKHKLPLPFVENFIRGFFRGVPEFTRWRNSLESEVKRTKYLRNPFGRRRWWYSRIQVTEMYNFPLQSTAADMMYGALIDVDRELPKGASIRFTVHDEIVVVAHKDVAREAFYCIRDNMEKVQSEVVEASRNPQIVKQWYPNGWYCPADPHIGLNWREAKKGNKELEKHLGVAK